MTINCKGSLINVDKLSVIYNRIVHSKLTWVIVALRRALHFVVKVGDRSKTATFYRDVLGMKILHHKDFEEGCKATCKGPYDGNFARKWLALAQRIMTLWLN
uniref:VOC domain-containing protein n=1 Tax=Oncorhynchus kisutch TaxID=8019 RepID=A0A8C7N230_ONCKI